MRIVRPINPDRLERVSRGLRPSSPLDLSAASAPRAEAPPPPPQLNLADVRISQFSLDLAEDLGYGGMIDVHASQEIDFYLIEFLASADEIDVPGEPNIAIIKAVGVRIALTTTRIKGEVAGNLATIAAAATMKSDTVTQNVKAEVHGCPRAMQERFFTVFGKPAAFNIDAMKSFGVAVSELAASMVKQATKDPTAFDPKPLKIVEYLPPDASVRTVATSNGYALHRITRGDSYEDAMDRLRSRAADEGSYPYALVDPVSVLIVYDQIVGDARKRPSAKQKQRAEDIQRLGR